MRASEWFIYFISGANCEKSPSNDRAKSKLRSLPGFWRVPTSENERPSFMRSAKLDSYSK
jgi:hypothetical protein